MKGKLFDASALVNIVISKGSKSLKLLRDQSILDLTIYEVGNSLWKLNLEKKINEDQACSLLDSFLLLMQGMKVLTINRMENAIKQLSIKKGLTFYDASYLIASKSLGLMLVTDDAALAKVASKYVKVTGSDNL